MDLLKEALKETGDARVVCFEALRAHVRKHPHELLRLMCEAYLGHASNEELQGWETAAVAAMECQDESECRRLVTLLEHNLDLSHGPITPPPSKRRETPPPTPHPNAVHRHLYLSLCRVFIA